MPETPFDDDATPVRSESASSDPLLSDPLLANPVLATGETGQIERPGDHQSPWVVGVLLALFASLISGLATIALTRDDGDERTAASVVDVDAEPGPTGPTAPRTTPPLQPVDGAVVDADDAADTVAAADGRLPAAGLVRVDDVEVPIDAACAVHLPLAPNDAESQVSTYLFFVDGEPVVIDRRFGDRDGDGAHVQGIDAAFESVVDVGDGGGFVATFADGDGATFDIAVHPAPGRSTCTDTLVTNEQGQLAFPYTRVVMFICADAETGASAGLTSEGGSFTAVPNDGDTDERDTDDGDTDDGDTDGGDTVTLTFRTDDSATEYVDETASSFESGDRLGYSGIVRSGELALDLTLDVTIADAVPCTSAELG